MWAPEQLAIGILILVIAILIVAVPRGGSARYPDGKCYLCRQGSALPGDTCPKCGTEQP